MIALMLAMVWARRGQAVTLALLSLFAVAAAVAAPAYLRAADQAVAAGQVRTSLPDERGVEISALVNENAAGGTVSFNNLGGALAGLPGFDYIYAAEFLTSSSQTNGVGRLHWAGMACTQPARCSAQVSTREQQE